MNEIGKIVIVPSDPISAYEKNGYGSWLERYYNPGKTFKEVFIVSPLEKGHRNAYGASIIGTTPQSFKRVIQDISPDIVRAYGGWWPSDLVVNNRIAAPVIVSLHDTSIDLMHPSICGADMLICMTGAVATSAKKKGALEQKIRILPNRIDPDIFQPIRNVVVNPFKRFRDGKSILHVGRKSPEKNIETVVASLKYLPEEYFAVFVGNGNCHEYQTLADSIGVGSRCFWVSKVDNNELPAWYSWCDCMCTPSLREGFGIVFIEAMACGAAIVTSNIAPLNEYLIHGENAILVDDYKNGEKLSQAIVSIEQKEFSEKLKKEALIVSRKFHLAVVDQQEKDLYLEALS